jgi:hypothetical protein
VKLSEYYRIMNEIAGRPDPPDHPRVTRKDLDWNDGPGKQGAATISFLDGVPRYLNWYVWDLDFEWMVEQVGKELGRTIKLVEVTGGNGHCAATIEMTAPPASETKP